VYLATYTCFFCSTLFIAPERTLCNTHFSRALTFPESKLDVVTSAIFLVRNMLHQAELRAVYRALYLQSFCLMFVTCSIRMNTDSAVLRDSPLIFQHRPQQVVTLASVTNLLTPSPPHLPCMALFSFPHLLNKISLKTRMNCITVLFWPSLLQNQYKNESTLSFATV
jgi:hypothetical protein